MSERRRTVVFLDAMGTLVTLKPWVTSMMREFTLVCKDFDVDFDSMSKTWNSEWRRVNQEVRRSGQTRFRTIRQLFVEAFASTGRRLGVELRGDYISEAVERVCNYVNRNAEPYPDVPKTLDALKGRGHKIGVISDADGDDLTQQLESAHLLRFFDTVTSSSEAMSYKPNSGIFELALVKMKCTSKQSCHIGDTQEFDIVGASRMGLSSFLVTHGKTEVKNTLPKPTYVIREISEVVPLLESSEMASST